MIILVNTPSGKQELIAIGIGGDYFDPDRIVWDTRIDGPLPAITLGGMVRVGDVLVFDQSRMDQHLSITEPQAAAQARATAKIARALAVDAITVTTTAGNTFDGDEVSQGRMSRAIIALQATGTASTIWVLADNTTIQATAAELTEALVLAGQAQAAIWVIP